MRFALFTTLRVRGGQPWFFEDHAARLGEGEALHQRVVSGCAGLADARVRVTVRGDRRMVDIAPYGPPEAPFRLLPVTASPHEDTVRNKTTDRGVY